MRLFSFLRRDLKHVPLAEVLIETRKKLAQDSEIKPPRQTFKGHEQKEKRHAEPTICGKCGCPTGYNDGVQPCNACFVTGLEAAHEIATASSEKVTKFQRRKAREQ
jgi:hypothetical protein